MNNASVEEIIALTTDEEKEKAAALMSEIDGKFAAADAELEKVFAENREEWVESLYHRVIEN